MRYLKKITHSEIEKLWGFEFPLPLGSRNKQLYLILKKDATPHKSGGGRYLNSDELKESDIIV